MEWKVRAEINNAYYTLSDDNNNIFYTLFVYFFIGLVQIPRLGNNCGVSHEPLVHVQHNI
jgi:hypothetical protein